MDAGLPGRDQFPLRLCWGSVRAGIQWAGPLAGRAIVRNLSQLWE
jgi:hypothetical protein